MAFTLWFNHLAFYFALTKRESQNLALLMLLHAFQQSLNAPCSRLEDCR